MLSISPPVVCNRTTASNCNSILADKHMRKQDLVMLTKGRQASLRCDDCSVAVVFILHMCILCIMQMQSKLQVASKHAWSLSRRTRILPSAIKCSQQLAIPAESIQAGLTSRAMQSTGAHTDLNINNLLSMIYPATPFTNIHSKLPPEAQKACEMSPRKSIDQQPAPPAAASYTSLYVKNCPPEADDLWVYERCTASPCLASLSTCLKVVLIEKAIENSSKGWQEAADASVMRYACNRHEFLVCACV